MVLLLSEKIFLEGYSEYDRTFNVYSTNKVFDQDSCENSIYTINKDNQRFRLDKYLRQEGIKNGWEVEKCLIKIGNAMIEDFEKAKSMLGI